MNEDLKKLTGKNPRDFEPVAYNLINNADVNLFKELVEKEDYLFDFIKQNVANRLLKLCNASNYTNLLKFLKFYSPSYEEFIISTLVRYADEDLTDKMLEIFKNGTEDEKIYCAKFFSYIQDPLALDFLRDNALSENSYLSSNCVSTLAILGDREIYQNAIKKLNSEDEFEKLQAVKLLVSYGDKQAVEYIIDTIKTSSTAEYMAVELPYLIDLEELEENDKLFILNLITDALGETAALSQIFDFRLYEQYEKLLKKDKTSKNSTVLINAKNKFETLTENDEYLFDETRDVKEEIFNIKKYIHCSNFSWIMNIY